MKAEIELSDFMQRWYIQAPFIIILLEVIAICVVRSVLAFMGIMKYRRKRDECYKAPILDSSYFSGGPSYLEGATQTEDNEEKK
uniref:Uncharacterized protein n=1 Tax=Parascaris univalens TaxID=6257 RepID=A0A915BCT5_PARUN